VQHDGRLGLTARVSEARSPRGRYNSVEVRELRFETDDVACAGGICHENGRISGAARCMYYWDRTTDDAFHRAYDTADGVCSSRAEIKC
jgi:hypothetical protein